MNALEHLLGPAALSRHGARTALLCGAEAVSYAALAGRVAQAAAALRALGVQRGERVLLLMRDTPEFAAAWLGALHAGAVAIALNTKLTEAEYRHVLADSGARLALVEDLFAEARADLAAAQAADSALAIAGEASARLAARWPGARDWRAALAAAPASAGPARVGAEDPAFWLYSSGTTGLPKGIVHAHRSVLPAGQDMREALGLAAGDTVLATSKLFFAYALEHGLLGPLATGAASVLIPDWPDAETVLAHVERHRPAALFSVPTFYRRLLALGAGRLAPMRAVRRFVAAGERLPQALVEQWREATGGEILSLYGMSETFCACMLTPPGSSNGARTGRPLAGVAAELRPAGGGTAGAGEVAVLWLRHPALALGYANRPEQTAAQFQDGWFCTRDLFTRDAEGYFLHQGRSDELLKVAGQWVRPGELEEAVAAEGAVAEAACVQVTDGDGFERLALFVAARGAEPEAVAAAGRACEGLPRHKRPKWIRALPELPRTATGKVQRFKLRELLEKELRPPRG
ncbi:MAG TPA: AMP-binding protein [Burkholderiales bacterium]|nr:AMP-binding protein [Burkholderiales bacterium]